MKKISEKVVYDGQWLCVAEMLYENKDGVEIIWETVKRKKSTVGVVVVARLMPSKRFVLVKQYRPAVGGFILGFPAGLSFDDPKQALNELKEETGYTGKIVSVSPILKTGSSLINDSGRIIYIEVDEKNPFNQNPVQSLEPSEVIDVVLVKTEEARAFMEHEQAKGVHIASNLWYFFGLNEVLNG